MSGPADGSKAGSAGGSSGSTNGSDFSLRPDDIVWEQTNGPEGGDFRRLEVNPENPREIITGSSTGLYKSRNGGASWEKVLDVGYVSDIRFSSERSGLVYLTASGTNVYRSLNGGEEWELVSPGDEMQWVGEIAVAPDNPDAVYVSSAEPARIYKSSNGGDSFREVARFPEEHISAFGVVGEGELLLGAGGSLGGQAGRFLRSSDDGRTWEVLDLGQARASFVSSILVNPDNPQKVYVGFGDAYNRAIREVRGDFSFTSNDGGRSWTTLPDDFHDAMLNYLSCSGPEGREVLAAMSGTLRKSTDGGRTWEELLGGNPFSPMTMKMSPMDFVDIGIDPENPDNLYLPLAGAGVAKSTDGGRTWKHINDGLVCMSVGNLAMHPEDPLTVYAGGLPTGVPGTFKTTDGGESWEKLDAGGVYHPFLDEVYVHPEKTDHVYTIADVGICYESTDAGNTWRPLFDPQYGVDNPADPETAFQFSSIYALEVAKNDPDILYAVKNGFGVFKSTDGGRSWRYQVFSPDYSYCLAVDPDDPNRVYSGYQRKVFENEASVYRNRVDTEEWDKLLTVPDVTGVRWIEIDPSDDRRLYAGTVGDEGTIYVSFDRGRSWEKLNEDLSFTTVWGHSQLQIHPRDADTVFAGTWGGGSYRSTDGGANWKKLDEDHTFSPTSIQISPDNPDIMYACDRTSPVVHRSDDGGETWKEYYDFRDDFGEEQFMTSAVAVVPGNPDRVIASSFRYPVAMAGPLALIGETGLIEDLSEGIPRSVVEIEIDEARPETVYVSAHVHGVFKSEDFGKTWSRLDREASGLSRTGYYDIDIAPDDSDVIYATSLSGSLPEYMVNPHGIEEHLEKEGRIVNIDARAESGVYKSDDGGTSWELVLETRSEAKGMDINPKNPQQLFVADMAGGVWVSTDGGESWRQENSGLGSTSMTSVKVKEGRIYAGTQGSGVYAGEVGRNGSIRWLPEKSNKPKAEVSTIQIEVDPQNPERIFASAYPGGMLRSDDGGKSWHDKNFLTPSIRVEDPAIQGYYSFDINPDDPGNVWMGVYGKGMFVSRDGMEYNMKADGRNGTMTGKHITKVLINPANTREVWVSSEEGVFVTKNGGRVWESVNEGLHTTDVYVMSIANDGTLYAGTRGYGVYRYDRDEDSWDQVRSIGDFGVHWSTWERPLYQYSDMLIDPENPANWYMSSFPTGLYKSTDAGNTWRESNIGFIEDGTDGIFSLTFHPHDTSTIFAGTYNGVSVSRDRGEHWRRISEGMDPEQWPYSIAIDPRDPDIMYAATKNGKDKGFHDRHEPPYDFSGKVYKTTDGGEHWFEIMNGLEEDNEFFNIIVHPKNPEILFVNMSFDGVAMSTDRGESWDLVNNGLENTRAGNSNNVSNSMVMSKDGRYLYFGSMGGGVWRTRLY